jgi:hypothetical protein
MANQGERRHQGKSSQIGAENTGRPRESSSERGGQGDGPMEQAREFAASAAQTAGNVASAVGSRVSDAAGSLGCGMKTLADTIRESGPRIGVLGGAASAVASGLETGGRYLEEHGLKDLGQDLSGLIRRNPIPAMLVGVAIGYLFARATNRS